MSVEWVSTALVAVRRAAGVGAPAEIGVGGHVWFGLLAALVVAVYWFVRPQLRVLRRAVTERFAAHLGTEMHPEDER
jgi:hypothetical protein